MILRNSALLAITFFAFNLFAQQSISFDCTAPLATPKAGHLNMGSAGDPALEINSKYMTIGDEPVLPVMGEIHFSRVPKARWREMLLKMKANGINVIASYVLWIHHEEEQGVVRWDGDLDLRAFVSLCAELDLYFVARIGPWCHAEVRNGATPDWVLDTPDLVDRSNNPIYQGFVKEWFVEIAEQLEGLYYADGGPIIGVQLENEYRRGSGGDAHILWLKETARALGMDAPMYTVTGWGNASVPENEVIPLYGGYPTAPWATNIKPLPFNKNFIFETAVNDPSIGNESGKKDLPRVDLSGYPYFTCELGIGNQISYHRRPIIDQLEGQTIAMAKVGSGSNLPGYYVFAGGSNPLGKFTTLEEDQDLTGYWNRYPKVSYDFQAAITESGALAPSYHAIKRFHYFLNAFGDRLAPLSPTIASPVGTFYASVRSNGEVAFLFGVNFQRSVQNEATEPIEFQIDLMNESIKLPKVSVPENVNFVWPINFEMGDRLLKYATCQPVTKIATKDADIWIFIENKGIPAQLAFDQPFGKKSDQQIFDVKPAFDPVVSWQNDEGRAQELLVLPASVAGQIWVLDGQFYISEATLTAEDGALNIYSSEKEVEVWSINALRQAKKKGKAGLFTKYGFVFESVEQTVNAEQQTLLQNAKWIAVGADEITTKSELYHHLYRKELAIAQEARITKAQLIYYSESEFGVRADGRWVNQQSLKNRPDTLDLTGYLRNGTQELLLDFPFQEDSALFAAELIIDFANAYRAKFVMDSTWQFANSYQIPRIGWGLRKPKQPEFVTAPNVKLPKIDTYSLVFDLKEKPAIHALYLDIDYTGDIAEIYDDEKLIADNFWNGQLWRTNLMDRTDISENKPLQLQIFPMEKDPKIYLEQQPKSFEIAEINEIEIKSVYKKTLSIAP